MSVKVSAVNMVSEPNYFFLQPNWSIVGGNATTLWLQLQISDELGTRRYVPQAGATLQVQFPRARSTSNLEVSQTISKAGAVNTDDRSLWKITLTSSDTQGIISGTVKFTLTEGSSSQTFVQNYFIKRTLTGAGH